MARHRDPHTGPASTSAIVFKREAGWYQIGRFDFGIGRRERDRLGALRLTTPISPTSQTPLPA